MLLRLRFFKIIFHYCVYVLGTCTFHGLYGGEGQLVSFLLLFIYVFGSEKQFLGDIQHTVVCLKPVFNEKEA